MSGEGERARNFYLLDVNLRRLLARRAPALLARHEGRLASFGAWAAGPVDEQAEVADRFAPPVLEAFDGEGRLANRIRRDPRAEAAHREAYARGVVGLNYGEPREPYLLTFAMGYLLSQADISLHCPVTLTGAVAHVLDRFAPEPVRDAFLPRLVRMDGKAWTGGTWATEKGGGSDLGANETAARPVRDGFALSGVKWFASNPDADVALVTARPEGAPAGVDGVGLYLAPRVLADGSLNGYRIRRLKEKIGTRALATGEVELDGAEAVEVAPPPRGLRVMMEAFEYSRIHNALAAAATQRRAFLEAADHANLREAFGAPLAAYPMVRDTLLDMQARLEASVALAFEAALAFDAVEADERTRPWLRVVTALAKYRASEDAVWAASRAIEVLGGDGYTEERVTARLFRDAQVLPVWEGTANIQALELLRLITGRGRGFAAFDRRVREALAARPGELGDLRAPVARGLDDCAGATARLRSRREEGPRVARRLLDRMADVLSATLLLEEAAADLAGGDRRKGLVARRYVERWLVSPPALAVGAEEDEAHRLFRALTGYERIEREASARPAKGKGRGRGSSRG